MATTKKRTTPAAGRAPVVVTSENFEALLLKSARQAAEIGEGRRRPAREYTLSARSATVAPPPSYDAARVRRVRAKLRVTQPVFAGLLNVSPSTVRAWERGAKTPEGPTRRLLEMAERQPAVILSAAKARG